MATTANSRLPVLSFLCFAIFSSTVLGKFGSYFWLFDLFSHFVFQYLLLSFGILIALLIFNNKNYVGIILAVTSIILNAANLVPLYVSNEKYKEAKTANRDSLKISSININSQNSNWQSLSDYLSSSEPDIVAFFEITPEWGKKINTLSSLYPYGKAILQEDNFGIGMISKIPLNNLEARRETLYELPFMQLR